MTCQPVFLPIDVQGIALVCDGPDGGDLDAWNRLLEPEAVEAGETPAYVTLAQVEEALAQHREAHPADVDRPVRTAKPKFKAGLGMAPGTKITQVGSSASPR